MKVIYYLLIPSILMLLIQNAHAQSVVSVRYGMVEDVQTVKKDSKHAGGALAGGAIGALLAGPRHRPAKIIGSAAAGAAIQGAATSGELQQYTVKLQGGSVVKISTEQVDIRMGDCVSVEQGEHANIRRVSTVHCEAKEKVDPPPHHVSAADNCQKAKDELTKAESDDEVENAIKKVRVLCED